LQEVIPEDMADAGKTVRSLIDRVGIGGAIVCVSDTLAVAAHQVLLDIGLRPGIDIGLVGFDDDDFAQAFGLTSLHQPLREIAQTLLSCLVAAESGAVAPGRGTVFEPTVVPRRSTDRSPSTHGHAITHTAGNRTDDGGSS
jgi:LacI family transcriptional regulator